METITIDKKNKIMDTLLQGRWTTKQRDNISERLSAYGFKEGGCYSTSAVFRWCKNTKGWKLSWGKRYNFGGKNTKYFTLYKYFKTEPEVLIFLEFYKVKIEDFMLNN